MVETAIASPAGRASTGATLGTVLNVLAPTLAVGVIARRPSVFGVADRLDADARAVRQVQRLAADYGPGPIPLAIPGRSFALVVDPEQVHRVLGECPEPFAPASLEKRYALAHFQPRGVLISHGRQRARRRIFNEAVLDTDRPLHQLGEPIVDKIHDEAGRLGALLEVTGELNADQFVQTWWRIVRRVVLGDAARDDHELTNFLTRLRKEANWGYAAARREDVYQRFIQRLIGYLKRGEPGSLVGLMADTPAGRDVDAVQQIPQWLFAFDPTGLVTVRALALLATHPEQRRQVHQEIDHTDLSKPAQLRRLRAAVLESARLWPTTPAVLRDTTAETIWPTGSLPAGTGLLIYAPFFHRNDQRLTYAHRFEPDVWLDEEGPAGWHGGWPLIPFSEGPGVCPGQNLVLLTASTLLSVLLERYQFGISGGDQLSPGAPLPMSFSPYRLRFSVCPRPSATR